MNTDREALKLIYKTKADMITDCKDKIELYERQFAKLFSYNPESLVDDEFTLNLIDRTYKRIRTEEMDSAIIKKIKQLI